MVIVTDANFEKEVLQAGTIPVVVDFWAPWCRPCREFIPTFEEFAIKLEGKVKLCKIDVNENPHTPKQYDVQKIPTIILFRDGVEVKRALGADGGIKLLNPFVEKQIH